MQTLTIPEELCSQDVLKV